MMDSTEKMMEEIHKHSSTTNGHLITMLTRRMVTRTQLKSALEHAKITVSRLEQLISRLG